MAISKNRRLIGLIGTLVIFSIVVMTACGSGLLNSPPPAPLTTSGNVNAQLGYAGEQQPVSGIVDYDASEVTRDGIYANDLTIAQERIILKTAYLNLVVESADQTVTEIAHMAEGMGGWVVTSSTSKIQLASGVDVSRGSITVRVPAAQLDEALTIIKSGGGSVESESISGQDVTQQYVDLKSRLTNLEAAEAQLREILADARKTEDVLSVFSQLVSTRGEIETVRGQIQYFDESAAFSSISVDLTPKAIQEPIQIAGWSPGRTAQNAIAALLNLLQGLADLVITIAIIGIPLLLIVGVPGWFIWRKVRRMKPQVVTVPVDKQN